MKSIIIVPIFFIALLLAFIIHDVIDSAIEQKEFLIKQDRIYFNDLVTKSYKASYQLNIDSLHYVVFTQSNSHEMRHEMLQHVDSLISVNADRLQILQ